MIQLPVSTNGNSDFDVTLEGETYTLQYRYNSRNSRLYMNIVKDGVVLKAGLRLIEGNMPGETMPVEEAPAGLFIVAQLKDTESIVTLGNLGINREYTLIYFSEDELF